MRDFYRVVIADWSLDARGQPGDTLAFEHVHDEGVCLVGTTCLGDVGWTLETLNQASQLHDEKHAGDNRTSVDHP